MILISRYSVITLYHEHRPSLDTMMFPLEVLSFNQVIGGRIKRGF